MNIPKWELEPYFVAGFCLALHRNSNVDRIVGESLHVKSKKRKTAESCRQSLLDFLKETKVYLRIDLFIVFNNDIVCVISI